MRNSKIRKELRKEIGAIGASLIAVVLAVVIFGAVVMKIFWDGAAHSGSSIDLSAFYFIVIGLLALRFIFGGSTDSSSAEFCDGGLESCCDYDCSDAGIGY